MAISEPLDLFEYSLTLDGEEKARQLVRLFPEICEHLYFNYLKALWDLTTVSAGKKLTFKKFHSFGKHLNNLHNRLSKLNLECLLVKDAAHIRNSCTHKDYDYLPATNSVIFRDREKEPITLELCDLMELIEDMYTASGKMMIDLANIYLMEDFVWKSGFLELIIDTCLSVLNGEWEEARKLEDKFNKVFEWTKQLDLQTY